MDIDESLSGRRTARRRARRILFERGSSASLAIPDPVRQRSSPCKGRTAGISPAPVQVCTRCMGRPDTANGNRAHLKRCAPVTGNRFKAAWNVGGVFRRPMPVQQAGTAQLNPAKTSRNRSFGSPRRTTPCSHCNRWSGTKKSTPRSARPETLAR